MWIREILVVIIILTGLYAGLNAYKIATDYIDVRAKEIKEILNQ